MKIESKTVSDCSVYTISASGPEQITSFTGENRFLSNFFPCEIQFEGILYPASEHAYIAAKTTDQDLRQKIADQVTPGKAKRLGRSIELRDGWDNLKLHYMRVILEIKFSDPELMKMLQNTSGAHLIEGNTWVTNSGVKAQSVLAPTISAKF